MELKGAGVFITGGSSGIGKAAARLFLEQGASVAIYSRNPIEVKAAVEELKAHVNAPGSTARRHPKASQHEFILGFVGDVTNATQLTKAVNTAAAKFGRLDVMVNNAGVYYKGNYLEAADKDELQVDVNVKGVLNGTKAALPIFQKQKRGQFVNLASVVVFMDRTDLATYSGTKSFVAHFSHCLRRELASKNIGVSAVYPGRTATHLFDNAGGVKQDVFTDSVELPARAIVECAANNPKDYRVGLWTNLTWLVSKVWRVG